MPCLVCRSEPSARAHRQQKNALLAQILRDNESHNRQQQAEMARLTETALDAQTMCERATARVNYFEQQLKLLTANDRRGAEASRP